MKRLHVHIAVPKLSAAVTFYTTLFGQAPSKMKSDYAKWQLDDPCVNFAISARGARSGVDHLGIQVDEDDELAEIETRLRQGDRAIAESMVEETGAVCCYAHSNKFWVTDPAGVAWETYRTLADVPLFNATNEDQDHPSESAACCAPPSKTPSAVSSGCCGER
ncbi:MAG: ArsI/CadI family heavy metal resistance metalloenzyme [Thioalkalivibrionaceae bacterium]